MTCSQDEQTRHNQAARQARCTAVAAAVRAAVPDARTLTMLDYGCGSNPVGLLLVDHVGDLILADSDAEAVAQASAAADGRATVSVRRLDLTREIPADLRADVVLSSMSWHHVGDLNALLAAIPVVAPGGRLLVADMDADDGAFHAEEPEFAGVHGFDRADLAVRLAEHGYADVTITDLWRGDRWVGGTLTQLSVFWLHATISDKQ